MTRAQLQPIDVPELLALGIEVYAGEDSVRARLLTSAQLRARSRGEVETPETINGRTKKPERGGLHCARIFGPIEDFSCICTKYRGEQHRGVRCEKCGVEVLPTAVRRQRFGHIELAAPLVHPLLADGIARLLGVTGAQLDLLMCGQASFDASGQLQRHEDYPPTLGGVHVRERLAAVDMRAMDEDEALAPLADYLTPAELMIEVLPVLPADLRPVAVDRGRWSSGDLNDHYRRVVNRNNRLRRLLELDAPVIITHNELRILQETVEQLFINERCPEPLSHRGRALASLTRTAEAAIAERDDLPRELPAIDQLLRAGAEGIPTTAGSLRTVEATPDDDYDF